MKTNLSESQARQGGRGRTVLKLMLASLALALIVWFFVALYGAFIAPEEGEGTTGASGTPVSAESLDQKPPSPVIEDPAEQPGSATGNNTLPQAPGGTTGEREPDLPGPQDIEPSGSGSDAPTVGNGAAGSQPN